MLIGLKRAIKENSDRINEPEADYIIERKWRESEEGNRVVRGN
jgi:hypothetical protein